jgi:hypothetical protein
MGSCAYLLVTRCLSIATAILSFPDEPPPEALRISDVVLCIILCVATFVPAWNDIV